MSKLYGLFIDLSNTPQSLNPQGLQPHFQNRSYPLIINTRKNTPKIPILPPFQMPFFWFFTLANSWWFSVMHASAFLIRETKIRSSLCSVFPLRIFMGACNQEERFWNFYCGVVTRRHSFGFSRNNMKGAHFTIGEIQWVRNIKRKILIFRFGVVRS